MPPRNVLRLVALAALFPAVAEAQVYARRNANGVIEATNIPAPDYRLIYPGKGTVTHSKGFRRAAYKGEFDIHVIEAGRTFGVAPEIVRAVIEVESAFDHRAVSSKGAQGLMQLMPPTARRFAVADSFDPRQNIFGGTQYLRLLLDLFNGDLSLALAAYNSGEGNVLKYRGVPPFKETQGYVARINGMLGNRTAWSGPMKTVAAAPSALRVPVAVVRASAPVKPRPRTYYRWRDAAGVLHVATSPPQGETAYTVIQAQN